MKSGFAVGSRIRTEHGERAVETLSVGDRVIGRYGRLVSVAHAFTSRYRKGKKNRAVVIGQGALGDGLPRRDLTVAPGQLVQTDLGETVRAIDLVHLKGVQILSDSQKVQFVSVAFNTPEVMFCSGVSVFAKPVEKNIRSLPLEHSSVS